MGDNEAVPVIATSLWTKLPSGARKQRPGHQKPPTFMRDKKERVFLIVEELKVSF